MKRILINATHAEEIRVALCNDKHLYDFDLENRTREQKKSNIYKGRVTRVEPSLEAVFVEYGAERQGFLPIREIASEYLANDPRSVNSIKQLIKEGDELIVQVEKEERGNKGAALSTYISLAGRYLVLMPNNPRGGGISRQISGKVREELRQILASFQLPQGMSVIVRTAGIGKSLEELHLDLNHLLNIWQDIVQQSRNFPAPRLVHQEAGVVTRAMRDYLRDDIAEIWVDNEYAYNEAANFIENVMPQQLHKLRKYTSYVPMFTRFDVEKQIETAYQREVRLPSGGSIVIDQTEALVSIDINSSKATKGADVSETAFNTNLEAADEIARQLRLRDMGGLIVIDFIDMSNPEHQKQVEKRLQEATKNDRARIQFAEISRFGLLEMSRQRVRPSLEETTGGRCPRCHGTGMIRDFRSLSLSIMRQIEEKALQEHRGEIQVDVPTDVAAFLLNEKRDSLVYLEQESGTRITILPHAHLESPAFHITFDPDGYAPSSYERINESQALETKDRGYDTQSWHTEESETLRQSQPVSQQNSWSNAQSNSIGTNNNPKATKNKTNNNPTSQPTAQPQPNQQPTAVAWLSNLFAPTQQAQLSPTITSQDAAAAIESIVNTGAKSLGVQGHITYPTTPAPVAMPTTQPTLNATENNNTTENQYLDDSQKNNIRKNKNTVKKTKRNDSGDNTAIAEKINDTTNKKENNLPKREPNSRREARGEKERRETLVNQQSLNEQTNTQLTTIAENKTIVEEKSEKNPVSDKVNTEKPITKDKESKEKTSQTVTTHEVQLHIHKTEKPQPNNDNTQHISLDNSKGEVVSTMVTTTNTEQVLVKQDETTITTDTLTKQVLDNVAVAIEPQHVEVEPVTKNTEQVLENTLTTETTEKTEPSKPTLNVIPTQGRAKNDPREVYQAYLQAYTPTNDVAPLPTIVKPISGTVKQFILQQLTDGQTQIDSFGIVSSFIKAVDKYYQANKPTPVATQSQPIDKEAFDKFFRNYGYQDLSSDSLDNYHVMISPSNQYHTQAGKTHASPAPVTQRASNDPRGQIVSPPIETTPIETIAIEPMIVEQITLETIPQVGIIEEHSTNNNVPTSTQTTHHYPNHSVGAWIVEKLGDVGLQLIQQGQLVKAYLQAHQVVTTDTDVVEIATDLVETTETFNLPTTLDNTSHNSNPVNEQEMSNIDLPVTSITDDAIGHKDEQQPKMKTSPASYKNMIESVAEQMKPTTLGVLNLTTPKVAKPRKKTTEKPTKTRTSKKVENAIVITKKAKIENTNAEIPHLDNPTDE